MFGVSFKLAFTVFDKHDFIFIDTNALTYTRLKYFSGICQYLITAASLAPTQYTKLIQSLRQLSLMINARALRHKSAGKFQVIS